MCIPVLSLLRTTLAVYMMMILSRYWGDWKAVICGDVIFWWNKVLIPFTNAAYTNLFFLCAMSDKRRVVIIVCSVLGGTLLSLFLFKMRRGSQPLDDRDVNTLITNFVFSLAIILGIGFFFIWNKKKD